MNQITGSLDAKSLKIAIVYTRWNEFITEMLLKGATEALFRYGCNKNNITTVNIPGAFEIPVTCKKLASTKKYDAIIAIGCVIKGATPHFEYVAGEAIKGISNIALETNIPISLGIITTDTIEQAIERAGTKAGNKGAEAAITAIEMANLLKQIK